jgi:glycolate oxidase FAD binding subunit
MQAQDISADLVKIVEQAKRERQPLVIVGGGTKGFYGRSSLGTEISISGHRGVTNYEPTELVLTARAGTPLSEIEAILAEQGQMLPFEPPRFGEGATLGGTLACGLSGPARPYRGAARDFVLGTRVLNGRGEVLRFGGEVMKNVAGYDVSRLMVGALGTLGILLEASLKVLPQPAAETTLVHDHSPDAALAAMHALGGKPFPLSGTAYDGERLYLRFSGAAAAVAAAAAQIGGERLPEGERFWRSVRDQTHPFFDGDTPLWRLSVPATAVLTGLEGVGFVEWGGAQRWLRGAAVADAVWQSARAVGGHATLFHGGDRTAEVFQRLPEAMTAVQRKVKQAFDPLGILNPGRLYAKW